MHSDRRRLFLDAYSNGKETELSSYAFDAVSKVVDGCPIYSQWLGVALRVLEDPSKTSIDQVIAANQTMFRATDRPIYEPSGYGGWSVIASPDFLDELSDVHCGYVLDGSEVGSSMIFPKDPAAWTLPDRTCSSFMNYRLWGNADYVFRIWLTVWFDEPQDHDPHRARFLEAAGHLFSHAVEGKDYSQVMDQLQEGRPFTSQMGSVEISYTPEIYDYPNETPQQHYLLKLEHIDRRTNIMRRAQNMWGNSKPRPSLGGSDQYQIACLRSSLLRMGIMPKSQP